MNHEELKALSPCRKGMDFAARHKTLAAAWDACERPDWMIWLARKKGWLTKEQSVRISIGAAEAVIGIYAAKYPTDDRPQKAIAAAKAWLVDPHAAAAAAAAAAYAAAVAYDADAAYAADRAKMNKQLADLVRSILVNPLSTPGSAAAPEPPAGGPASADSR